MIGILDPAFLLVRDENEVMQSLEFVLRACKEHNIELTPLKEYWNPLWRDLGRDLELHLTARGKSALQQLRRSAPNADDHIAPLTLTACSAWRRGFTVLFGAPHLDPRWVERMALAVIRGVSSGLPVVMFCRRVLDRNLIIHSAENSTLYESKRWALYVQPRGLGPVQVICVHHPRNFREKWTSRFDWRLPTISDGARYPFCVPGDWWKGSTIAFRTISAKHAWLDANGNGWARPNINGGAGYHWDVYIRDPALKHAIGVDQINIVEYGAPPLEGLPGHLHHVPTNKEHTVNDAGWSC
jgi:hypothetical protein